MLKLALRRVAALIPTLLVIVTISFAIIRLAPGGPFDEEQGVSPAVRANVERLYGLDEPLPVQYLRYLRARLESLTHGEAEAVLNRILAGETAEGVRREDLLHMPNPDFFRRRGVPAFKMTGSQGEAFTSAHDYLQHLVRVLPESYRASRDYKDYADALLAVEAGTLTLEQAANRMPALRRVAGACPCSKSVRWVIDEPAAVTASAQPVA